jgi:bis(5'-adenosyl)-triphosphatase
MVIPKRHVARLNDLTNEEYNDLMNFMRTVSNGLMRAFAATGIDWTLQDGEDAGQTIPHLHFHLIPRRAHDLPQPGDWFPKLRKSQLIDSDQRPRLSSEEIHQAVEKLRPYF